MTIVPALALRGISIQLGEVSVLDDVTLDVLPGEIHALLGEQKGSGKTTLFKILAGLRQAGTYKGQIEIAGQPVNLRAPQDALRHGISTVPRHSGIFSRMTVAENITLGQWQQGGRGFLLRQGVMEREALAILAQLDLKLDPSVPASRLSAGQQRLVMLARALATQPKVIVLDEPVASLASASDQSQVIRGIRRLAERNIGCLYLTQRPAEATLIADRVTVLRDGRLNGSWPRVALDELTLTQAMISQRIGSDSDDDRDDPEAAGGLLGALRSLFSWNRG